MVEQADAIIVGAGLAGLVATAELVDALQDWLPNPGWAERGGYLATEHGNSVPRFHIVWGTGPGLIAPFIRRVRAGAERGLVRLRFRHRVAQLTVSGGEVVG
jgi:predicted oxidoreductase